MEGKEYKTLKLRLYPNNTQKKQLDRSIEISGYVYNSFIYYGKHFFLKNNQLPSINQFRGLCTKYWKNCKWMHDVANNSFFECANEALRSLKDCLKNSRYKTEIEFPHYKKYHEFQYFGFLSIKGFKLLIKTVDGKTKRFLKLCKIDEIKVRNPQKEPWGEPKTCHIFRERYYKQDKYFATISYQLEPGYTEDTLEIECPNKTPKGLDMGISNTITVSDGTQHINKNYQKLSSETLKKLHRQLSEETENSDQYLKIKSKLKHTYDKIKNRRKEEINAIAKELVFSNGQLYAENLSINQLRKTSYSHKMNSQYDDASLGKIMKRLEDLSKIANRPIKFVYYEYSSQECCNCGHIVKKKLDVRIHICPKCGIILDRDVNAAKNILKRGLASNPEKSKNG